MLSIKEAVQKIKNQLPDFFDGDISDIRLEEFNAKDLYKEYRLTVSFLIPPYRTSVPTAPLQTSLEGIATGIATAFSSFSSSIPGTRVYKDVVLDSEDGRIISMKIHENA
ncbi:MAG: hypothetical protein LBG78_04615 [Azoarcus sp.]|jgi:hypothetical protein|nr:hypothetical protein [Azoarcus sp.]